jgi:hydrogenase maturation protein HypF
LHMDNTIDMDVTLPRAVLALGGELKNTVCFARDNRAWVSGPFDDLKDADTFNEYCNTVRSAEAVVGEKPACIAYDLHPEYLSHKIAMSKDIWPDVPRQGVQHHEAHVASCAASENIWDDVIGLAFDGTGYGTDGSMWGGEFFTGSVSAGFTRQGRLKQIPLPGGEAAIREPWRLAAALEYMSDRGNHDSQDGNHSVVRKHVVDVPDETWHIVTTLLGSTVVPHIYSSSIGRLFDGISALLGICTHATAEAEAAIALEKAAGKTIPHRLYDINITETDNGLCELEWTGMIREIMDDMGNNVDVSTIAAAFHDSLAEASARMCVSCSGNRSIVLGSGGVFWNKRFKVVLKDELSRTGMRLVTPKRIPPSDAGLSLGQAVLASYAMKS